MKRLLLISFDAVGDIEFDTLLNYPNFARLAERSAVTRQVQSIFLSNTYPIHTSVATGVMPFQHGVTSNNEPFPIEHPVWITDERRIRTKTLWQAAAQRNMRVAAVMWPVTAHSKTIKYNVPEVLARPGKSQIITSLKAGSKALQIKLLLRHRKLLNGIRQPALDSFTTACMVDILQEKRPDFALVHLTCYDTLCHTYGKNSKELNIAYESLDRNLGALLKAAGEDMQVILFSDHSQINVHKILDPNSLLYEAGLLIKEEKAWKPGETGCFVECCGGSAFFHPGTLPEEKVTEIAEQIRQYEGFNRFLTEEEMQVCGIQKATFGFCALPGYCYDFASKGENANHGYPLDYNDYNVFYLAKGEEVVAGTVRQGGSLLDIAPLAAKMLDLDMM